jgi:hypothetical protein
VVHITPKFLNKYFEMFLLKIFDMRIGGENLDLNFPNSKMQLIRFTKLALMLPLDAVLSNLLKNDIQ